MCVNKAIEANWHLHKSTIYWAPFLHLVDTLEIYSLLFKFLLLLEMLQSGLAYAVPRESNVVTSENVSNQMCDQHCMKLYVI